MSRFKKILIGLVVFFVLVGLAGFFVLPPIVKPLLLEKLSETLHREVSLEALRINPYTLSVNLKGFVVREKDGKANFISFDDLYLNAELIQSILQRAPILKEIRITNPYLHVDRRPDGSYNFSDLIPKEEGPKEKKAPPRFSLHNIHVINGSLDFQDGPKKTNHTVREINLAIPFLTNIDYYVDEYVEPKFSAVVNGDPYKLEGRTKPFKDSLETSLDVDIQDLDIPHYMNYVPIQTNFKVISAALDAKTTISFIRYKDKPPSLKITGNVEVRNLALDDLQGRRVVQYPSMTVAMASVEPLVPFIHLSRVHLQSPELVIRRTKEGELIHPKPLARVAEEVEKREEKPVPIRVDEARIEQGKLTFIDEFPEETVKLVLDPMNLRAENISTEKGTKGTVDLALTINRTGTVAARGPLSIDPLSAEMDIDVKNIALRIFQPYIADRVKINVTRGGVSTKGTLSVARGREGSPTAKYAGNVLVADFASIDKVNANDFLKWKSLFFDRLHVGHNPTFVDIRGASLTDFYVRFIINPDGTRNVQQIFGKEEGEEVEPGKAEKPAEPEAKEPGPAKAAEAPANIRIGKVTLQGGTIDFTDHFIKPNYTAKMLNMSGSITGLSSEEISRAKVELKGNLGRGSPIDIKGTINPLIKDRYVDMDVSFKDIELSPVTPYSIKYLGYTIAKGKLTFDVKYLIEGNKLTAQNKFFFDQLTFGEKVESPDAIKLPVTTAVSLLKDRNGQINLDVPLSGSLDDPKFRIWPIVWQIIVNLITKAVTAPFALLGSLFGGGEELGYVEFDPGSADLTEAAEKKLNILIKALEERPALKMDIEGYVDAEKDVEGLKREALARKMKAQKLNEMIRKGEPAVPLEEVEIAPGEYEKYLTLVYKAEKFPKPRNIIGLAKTIPAPEMEKLFLTHTPVSESDLRLLGSERAENVKEFILESGKVTPDRVFVVEPKSLTPPKREKALDSRVEFKLK